MADEHYFTLRSSTVDTLARAHGALALAVFTYLCRRADRDGCSWPSYQRIADDLGIGRSSAIRYTRLLESAGYLRKERREATDTNRWSIPLEHRGGVTVTPPSVTVTPAVVSEGHPGGVTVTPKVNTKKNRSMDDPAFETFWLEYPRKQAKDLARQAWGRARSTADGDAIVAAVRRQKLAGMFSPDPKFIPMASTWLNQRRFEDEVVSSATKMNGRYAAG